MKILYHHRTRAGDAQGIHIAEIQRAFRQRGHEVIEVALVEAGSRGEGGRRRRRGPRPRRSRLAAAAPSARCRSRRGWSWATTPSPTAAWRGRSALHRPDFLYERYAANTFAGLAAARRHGVPFVLEVNSPLAREKAEHDGLFFRGVTRADRAPALRRRGRDPRRHRRPRPPPRSGRRAGGQDRGDAQRRAPRASAPARSRRPARAFRRGLGHAGRTRRSPASSAGSAPGTAWSGCSRRRPRRSGGRRASISCSPATARPCRRCARRRDASGWPRPRRPLRPGAARGDRGGARRLRHRGAAGGHLLRLPDEDPRVHGRRPRHRRAGLGQRARAADPRRDRAALSRAAPTRRPADLQPPCLPLARDPALRRAARARPPGTGSASGAISGRRTPAASRSWWRRREVRKAAVVMRNPEVRSVLNAFSVDVEDYFQVGAFENAIPAGHLGAVSSRGSSATRAACSISAPATRSRRPSSSSAGWPSAGPSWCATSGRRPRAGHPRPGPPPGDHPYAARVPRGRPALQADDRGRRRRRGHRLPRAELLDRPRDDVGHGRAGEEGSATTPASSRSVTTATASPTSRVSRGRCAGERRDPGSASTSSRSPPSASPA